MLARAGALALVAVVLSVLELPWRPPTLCLLRSVTGIPCPMCGGTTALVHLGGADVVAALRASPLVVLGAPVWVLWSRIGPALSAWARRRGRPASVAAGIGLLAASEAWQVHRFFG